MPSSETDYSLCTPTQAFNLSNLSIIIVKPQYAGNVGSIARACHNLGVSNLILVNPCDYLVGEAERMAKHAIGLLQTATVVDTLEDCLDTHHLLVGTTQRRRDKQVPFYDPEILVEKVSGPMQQHKIGIVFGRENHGLTNDELALCNLQSAIPANAENPVFNLSQAVLIYAYEFFKASSFERDVYLGELATQQDETILYKHLEEMMTSLPIDTHKGRAYFVSLFKRVLGRAQLEVRDVRLFHKLADLVLGKSRY